MEVRDTQIPDVKTLHWPTHRDERGFFARMFDAEDISSLGMNPHDFVQMSHSRSKSGAIRGIHTRRPPGETKIVRCISGNIFDVVVDLRPGSSAFGSWQSFEFGLDPGISLLIPAGCGHAWQAISDVADVTYAIGTSHDPTADVTIAHDDPELAIPWPLPVTALSERDRAAPSLSEILDEIRSWRFS